jgi:hypothetical protein
VHGVEATRLRLEIPDATGSALANLTEMQQEWFGITSVTNLDRGVTVNIWSPTGWSGGSTSRPPTTAPSPSSSTTSTIIGPLRRASFD